MINKNTFFLFLMISLLMSGCKKDWLEEKRDLAVVVPSSLGDMRRLMNETNTLRNDYRMLAVFAGDEYYVTDNTWNTMTWPISRLSYIWQSDIYGGETNVALWDGPYTQIFYTNIVLEGLDKITAKNNELEEYNDIKGSALFFRSRAFYALATQFALPYINGENGDVMGIPLKLSSDIDEPVHRNTLAETYTQITNDLKAAVGLLRIAPEIKTDASKPAAMGLLARVYLAMADYEAAYHYADSCLSLYNSVLDFNQLDLSPRYPFALYNEEVIFESALQTYSSFVGAPNGLVDSNLFAEYDINDLRRDAFFVENSDGTHSFRGVYNGATGLFGGISVNEILLIRAEAAARLGKTEGALADMNSLLEKRFRTGFYRAIQQNDRGSLIDLILLERRKELLFRGLRWEDLRRLNRELGREITLMRTVNGETYVLEPGDKRYVFKIPEYVLIETGIEQND